MKNVFVRPVNPGDSAAFVKWSVETKNNLFDPDVAKYPSTFVLAAFDENGVIAYLPVQQPLMMEALALRPDAKPAELAVAGKELTQAVVTFAHQKGSGEIYFVCKEPTTCAFAERHGFEKLPWSTYRIKLSKLEGR